MCANRGRQRRAGSLRNQPTQGFAHIRSKGCEEGNNTVLLHRGPLPLFVQSGARIEKRCDEKVPLFLSSEFCFLQASFVPFKRNSVLHASPVSSREFRHFNCGAQCDSCVLFLPCVVTFIRVRHSLKQHHSRKPKPQLRNTFSSESVKRETCSRSHAHTPCDAAL